MTDFLRRHALLFTSVLLLVCSFQLMSASMSNRELPRLGARVVDSALTPMQKVYHELLESTKYIWSHYLWLLDVETERNDLVERIKELEAQNSRLMEFESENLRLRNLLHFSEETGHNGLVASVIGRDPSNWIKTVTIDRGANDGVRPGLAVVDGNAIVGQTTAVTGNSAKVLLLTDNTNAIDAIVQSCRASGIAEGGSENEMLHLRYVEKLEQSQIHAGDRVIASGIDGVFPKGTLIGVVHRVDADAPGLFQYVEIKPSADLHRLENVLIIVPEKNSVPQGRNGEAVAAREQ
jgi:rod shape-determining protein MreC